MKINTFDKYFKITKFTLSIIGILLGFIILVYTLILIVKTAQNNRPEKVVFKEKIVSVDFLTDAYINYSKKNPKNDYRILITYFNENIEFFIYDGLDEIKTFSNVEKVKNFFNNN